ncbi:MAG: hypothetical protein ACE5FL_10170 [Myxococcota bacterium]
MAPWDFEAVFELVRLLVKSGQRDEARRFLEGLEVRATGARARRVYAGRFRLDGDLRHAWRWLRSFRRDEAQASPA